MKILNYRTATHMLILASILSTQGYTADKSPLFDEAEGAGPGRKTSKTNNRRTEDGAGGSYVPMSNKELSAFIEVIRSAEDSFATDYFLRKFQEEEKDFPKRGGKIVRKSHSKKKKADTD